MCTYQTTAAEKHTTAGFRLATDDYAMDGRLHHSVCFPSGPIDCIGFSSDYCSVRVGHEALMRASVSEDPTEVLMAVARNRRFSEVTVIYRHA